MFATKAVRIWRGSSDRGRVELVSSYLEHAGNFQDIKGGQVNQEDSPPGDPLFAVVSRKEDSEGEAAH